MELCTGKRRIAQSGLPLRAYLLMSLGRPGVSDPADSPRGSLARRVGRLGGTDRFRFLFNASHRQFNVAPGPFTFERGSCGDGDGGGRWKVILAQTQSG